VEEVVDEEAGSPARSIPPGSIQPEGGGWRCQRGALDVDLLDVPAWTLDVKGAGVCRSSGDAGIDLDT
jgi:hypothetical protein